MYGNKKKGWKDQVYFRYCSLELKLLFWLWNVTLDTYVYLFTIFKKYFSQQLFISLYSYAWQCIVQNKIQKTFRMFNLIYFFWINDTLMWFKSLKGEKSLPYLIFQWLAFLSLEATSVICVSFQEHISRVYKYIRRGIFSSPSFHKWNHVINIARCFFCFLS